MKFNAALLNVALAVGLGMPGLIGMAGTVNGLNVPIKEKVQARVEARLAELKGVSVASRFPFPTAMLTTAPALPQSELTGRTPDYCTQCLSCGPNCDACCCCYGGCPGDITC